MTYSYIPEYPIIVALAGSAGVGKTSTADKLVENGVLTKTKKSPFVWDHLFFAAPIYEMVTVRTKTQGSDSQDRILYGLHDIVHSLMQRNCGYEDLVELVYDLAAMECNVADGQKPRTFMQRAGDLCRDLWMDCFPARAIKQIYTMHRKLIDEWDAKEEDYVPFVSVISDLRFQNEIDLIREQPNGFVVKLDASKEALNERLIQRSGKPLTDEQWNHPSEAQLRSIPDDKFDLIIDTNTLNLEAVAETINDFLVEFCSVNELVSQEA